MGRAPQGRVPQEKVRAQGTNRCPCGIVGVCTVLEEDILGLRVSVLCRRGV